MRTLPKSKPILALLAVAALLALPAAANATLSYTKGIQKPRIYIAKDNGKGAREVGPGSNSHLSPNGELLVYERETRNGAEMRLYSLATHKSERLLNPWRESDVFAWSPDSGTVAALRGGFNGPATLLLIDVESGRRTKVARGYVSGVSFSPESDEIAYGIAKAESLPLKSDVYRYKIGGRGPQALTHDHDSSDPLWGPAGQIVFVRELGAKQRRFVPKNELFLMNEDGRQVKRLTTTKVDPFAQGLSPLAWLASGRQLLAEFGGQDQSYAVAVNAVTGAQKALTKNHSTGFWGGALSPDGETVLGTAAFGFGSPHPRVVTVPFKGGRQKVLARGAYEPSWGG